MTASPDQNLNKDERDEVHKSRFDPRDSIPDHRPGGFSSLSSILFRQGTDSIEEDPCGPAVVLVVSQDALLDNRIGGFHPYVEPFD